MGISLLFFLLFMRFFSEISGGSQDDDQCKASKCSPRGPVIRFPFRQKHQPEHCGYPGFELSCLDQEKWTILELPYSPKLWVEKINYTAQEIVVRFYDYSLERQILNVNICASPFQFTESYPVNNVTFFRCSEPKPESFSLWPVPSCFLSTNPVYAAPSYGYLAYVNLTSCQKILNSNATQLPPYIFSDQYEFSLNWLKPMCGICESEGRKC